MITVSVSFDGDQSKKEDAEKVASFINRCFQLNNVYVTQSGTVYADQVVGEFLESNQEKIEVKVSPVVDKYL